MLLSRWRRLSLLQSLTLLCTVQPAVSWRASPRPLLSTALLHSAASRRDFHCSASNGQSLPTTSQLLQQVDSRLTHWDPLVAFLGRSIPDEKKWQRNDVLTQILKKDPENVRGLLTRAVTRFKCGIPFNAYSDCERIRNAVLAQSRVEKVPIDSMNALIVAVELILLSFLEMKMGEDHINKEMTNLLLYFGCVGENHADFAAKVRSIVERDLPARKKRELLASSFDAATTLDTETIHGKILMLFHSLWQSVEANEKQMEQMLASIRKTNQNVQMVSLSMPSYRGGPGGGRDPAFVSRTLATLRKEALQNVDVVSDPEKGGFKLVAKRDIAEGETFLTEEPIVSISSSTAAMNRCAFCMEPLLSRAAKQSAAEEQVCGGCGERYCSTQCQNKAWQQYHSLLCKSEWNEFLKAIDLSQWKSSFPYNFCQAVKLILMGVCRGESPLQWPELQVLHRLTDSPTPIDPAKVPTVPFQGVDKIIGMYDMFRATSESLVQHVHLDDIIEIMGLLQRNAMGEAALGTSTLFCVGSFANHDCRPNTDYDGNPPKLTFRATRNIARGEEITISYVDVWEDWRLRDAKLQAFYGFSCSCLKCKSEAKLHGK